MSNETLFLIANFTPAPFWALLVLAPRSRWTDRLVHSPLPALLLVPVYAWLLFFGDDPGAQGANYWSLHGVMQIFTTPRTVIACWIHYLVFDLFVGAWIARDARRLGIPHLATVPALALTLFFGPIGYLVHLVVRYAWKRRAGLDESSGVSTRATARGA